VLKRSSKTKNCPPACSSQSPASSPPSGFNRCSRISAPALRFSCRSPPRSNILLPGPRAEKSSPELPAAPLTKPLCRSRCGSEPETPPPDSFPTNRQKMTVPSASKVQVKGGAGPTHPPFADSNKGSSQRRRVLQSPRLTDQEVEAFAAMANLTIEILRLIASNRVFSQRTTRRAQTSSTNPKLPSSLTHLLP